jgi:hypothetical protein
MFTGGMEKEEQHKSMTYKNNMQQPSRLRPTAVLCWLERLLLLITLSLAAGAFTYASAQTCELQGTVSVSSANGPTERLPGANLNLTLANADQTKYSAVTNEQGEYKFTNLSAGLYTLQVDLSGFKQHTRTVTIRAGITTQDIALEIGEVSDSVTIVADAEELNSNDATQAATFKQDTLQTLPLVNEQFQDALPLVPGVIRGPDGLLNMKGARASESGMTVNSANVTDPVTGESAINLPLEAVQSVKVVTNPYAPEYGQFTGAITSVQTKSGSEKFNVNVQSIFPRLRRRDGAYVGIASFTPRVTFSGPIIKNRLKFLQSFEYRFVRTPIENLPQLKRDTDVESFDSVSQFDLEINDRNHLTTTFSLFPQKQRYVGLNTFNPQEVTPNFKQRGFLWAVNDRLIVNSNSLLESSFSIKQFDADVFPGSGNAPMDFAPNVNSGNFFNTQARQSKRYQALGVYIFNPPNFAGTHFMKVGGGISYVTFDGRNTSNTVRILRAAGTRSQQLDFIGSGQLNRNETQFLAYFADKWDMSRRLTIEYGVRYDRDDLASENNFAPRLGFAFLPILDGRTVLRGGIGLFYDDIGLNVATFSQLQDRVLTRFGPGGQEIIGLPQRQRSAVLNSKFRTPRSVNWNIELDREWLRNLLVRISYQQRQGSREFVLNPIESQDQGSILGLDNSGSSDYRELEVTARYKFRERDEFVASYVRSSAKGDLNDFNSYFGNFENPIIKPNEYSRLAWDSPNRFLFHGQFHTKFGLTVAPVLDVRTGFPYSIIDEDRNFVGSRNQAGRFPNFFSLDLQIFKTVSLLGKFNKYRAKLGFKVFNLTDHFNPRDFQNNLASDNFGSFSNSVGRKFGMRLTFVKK